MPTARLMVITNVLQLVRDNPDALPLVMEEVEARWPHLLKTLEDNQEALQQLISEPPEPSKQAQVDQGSEMARHEVIIRVILDYKMI